MFLERDCSLKYAHAHRICGFSNEGKKFLFNVFIQQQDCKRRATMRFDDFEKKKVPFL